jgi:hypothetical protein
VNQSRYKKLAEAAYDRIADDGDEFDINDVIDEIIRELSSEKVNAELMREFAQSLAEKIDDKKATRHDRGQLDLLTGQEAALDAVWRIGHGRRKRARYATRPEVLRWLAIRRDNAQRVAEAYEADRQVAVELLVYMTTEETTVEKAVEARKKAKP